MSAQHSGSMKPPRKLHIKSYGCQMNVYDAQRMVDTLAPEGFVETASVDDADLVILNTCHIREKASEKVYSELGRLRVDQGRSRAPWPPDRASRSPAASHRPKAMRSSAARRRSMSWSDRKAIIICRNYWPVPAVTAARWRPNSRSRTSSVSWPPPKPEAIRARGISSFVTVQEGCDKFCTFCVVPYTRGAEVSRPVAQDRRRRAPARRQRRARNHADRAERQRLSRRRTGRPGVVARRAAASACGDSGHRPLALLDQPSPRCRRDADRGASRTAGADAVRAPSGAVRFRPDSGRHEPQAYRR